MATGLEKIEAAAQINQCLSTSHSEPIVDQNQKLELDRREIVDPTKWPTWYKWVLVLLVSTMGMIDILATTIVIPAVPQILQDFQVNNALYSTIVVSIWELGEGLGPFVVAPLSEIYGRAVVYHTGNLLFLLCLAASALSTNLSMLVAFRFLNGLTTTILTLAPSIIGDIFIPEQRGAAMALAQFLPLVAPVVAPIIGAYMNQNKGWRWTIWLVAIAVGVLMCISLAAVRETYRPVLLKRQLRSQRSDAAQGNSVSHVHLSSNATRAMLRPLRIFAFSPVVALVSLYTAFSYGTAYIILTTLTKIFETHYGFSKGAVGLLFLGQASGMLVAMALYGTCADKYFKYRTKRHGSVQPESRLLFMVIGAVTLPIGFFLYGWTLEYQIVWIAPIIGNGVVGFSCILAMLPTENYLVDVFDAYGASAIAIGVVLRAFFGALLPLVGPPLYTGIGYGWGNSMLGFISAAFLPGVVALYVAGHRIRGNPRRWRD